MIMRSKEGVEAEAGAPTTTSEGGFVRKHGQQEQQHFSESEGVCGWMEPGRSVVIR